MNSINCSTSSVSPSTAFQVGSILVALIASAVAVFFLSRGVELLSTRVTLNGGIAIGGFTLFTIVTILKCTQNKQSKKIPSHTYYSHSTSTVSLSPTFCSTKRSPPISHFDEARQHLLNRQLQQAETSIEKCSSAYPTEKQDKYLFYLEIAEAYLQQDLQQAQRIVQLVTTQAEPTLPIRTKKGALHLKLAELYYRQKNFDEACSQLDQLYPLELTEHTRVLYLCLTDAHYQKGNLARAESLLQKALLIRGVHNTVLNQQENQLSLALARAYIEQNNGKSAQRVLSSLEMVYPPIPELKDLYLQLYSLYSRENEQHLAQQILRVHVPHEKWPREAFFSHQLNF
ncbi:MAG: hypothetical protein JSS62_05210 [Verrucomicrobia bacterium]|nr:hypothetical protein [Verrucomicrobiota bacterium]MBS0647453.1 hypothetical protein [Verrucomicrobiota bacterium]